MLSAGTLKRRVLHFIGDGDSEAFREVINAEPYNGIRVRKRECDGRTLRVHLGDREINKLQNYS